MSERIEAAKKAHKGTGEALIEAVRQEYPVGSVVSVTIGNATFDAEIVRHSDSWWYCPGEMVGRNLRTGKLRKFGDSSINR